MEWVFKISYDRRTISLKAKIIYNSEQVERLEVSGRNRSIILQSIRPLLVSKGLKNKRITWKLINGTINNSHLLEIIINTVELHLKAN